MKITKLFKILCLFPILAECNQTQVAEKEQLIVPTYYFDDSYEMPEIYRQKVEKMSGISGRNCMRYDVTPNELRGLFALYATKEFENPDIILYKGELYSIWIPAFSGVACFAYYKGNGKEIIYYTNYVGSGFVHIYVGAFDFKTKQEMVVNNKYERPEYLYSDDYNGLIYKSIVKDGSLQLQAYKMIAILDEENRTQTYEQKELLYEDLLQKEILPWSEWEPYDE